MRHSACVFRRHAHRVGAGAIVLFVALNAHAATSELVSHNGLEDCWSKALTKPQFLDLLTSTVGITGMTVCIPRDTGSSSGVDYDVCNTTACPGDTFGCPVTMHSGNFDGDFATGDFSTLGVGDNVSVPITYSGILGAGNCTVTLTNIVLSYAASFALQPDGNNGSYMASLTQSPVSVVDSTATTPDTNCELLFNVSGPYYIAEAEVLATAQLQASMTQTAVGEAVCPLQP